MLPLTNLLRKYALPLYLSLAGCGGAGFSSESRQEQPENSRSGANISRAATNDRGIASFADQQDGNIEILVQDEEGMPVSNLNVTFIDQVDNAFTLTKPDYVAHFEIFPGGEYESVTSGETNRRLGRSDNSRVARYIFRVYTERSFRQRNEEPLTVWEYRQQREPRRINALEGYLSWAEEEGYRYRGCLTREELREARQDTLALLSVFGGGLAIHVASTVVNRIFTLEEAGLIETLSEDTYDIYEPANFTAPPLIRGVPGRSRCGEKGTPNGDSASQLRISLRWDETADLDLHLYAPNDCHIFYGNQSCEGGTLEKDIICQSGLEQIQWENPPPGRYGIETNYYGNCRGKSDEVDYTVEVSVDGSIERYQGRLSSVGNSNEVAEFDL